MAPDKGQPKSKQDDGEAFASLQKLPGWANENRLKAAIFGSVGTLLATGTIALLLWLGSMSEEVANPDLMLAEALQKLDDGQLYEAKQLAESIRNATDLSYDKLGGPLYILGRTTFSEAEESSWDLADKKRKFLLAAGYLEESHDRGFPPHHKVDGFATLGSARFAAGQYALAIPSLKTALEATDDQSIKTAMHGLLHQAYALDSNPDYAKALMHVNKFLEDPNTLGKLRSEALLAKGTILFRLDQIAETRQVLSEIPSDAGVASEVFILDGQISLLEAERLLKDPALIQAGTNREQKKKFEDAIAKKFEDAIEKFGKAQQRDTFQNIATRKAAYLLGITSRKMGDLRSAEPQLINAEVRYGDFPEGLSAALELAEVRIELRDYEKSIEALYAAMLHAGKPREYFNPWISLDDFTRRIEEGYNNLLTANQHESALRLTDGMFPLFTRERVTELRAQALDDWGEALFDEARTASEDKAPEIADRARKTKRSAGKMYSRLAKHRIATRYYSEDIWNAANNFLAGQNYVRAAALLRVYLENAREKRPHALVSLGKALLSLGKIDEALLTLNECIDFFPKDPAVYEARLLASQALREKNKLTDAIELLNRNLYGELLRPESNEWRDSLFAIGELYYLQGSMIDTKARSVVSLSTDPVASKKRLDLLQTSEGSFREAIKKLREAIDRYSEDDKVEHNVIMARYMLAQSYQRASQVSRAKLANVSISTTRETLVLRRDTDLTAAYDAYQDLQQTLNQKQANGTLTSLEGKVLQNSMFSQGASLFAMEEYERAIDAYDRISGLYQNEPAVLEALVQQSRCERKLNQIMKSRQTIKMATRRMDILPPDADYEGTTRFNQKQWQNLLDWLTTL